MPERRVGCLRVRLAFSGEAWYTWGNVSPIFTADETDRDVVYDTVTWYIRQDILLLMNSNNILMNNGEFLE